MHGLSGFRHFAYADGHAAEEKQRLKLAAKKENSLSEHARKAESLKQAKEDMHSNAAIMKKRKLKKEDQKKSRRNLTSSSLEDSDQQPLKKLKRSSKPLNVQPGAEHGSESSRHQAKEVLQISDAAAAKREKRVMMLVRELARAPFAFDANSGQKAREAYLKFRAIIFRHGELHHLSAEGQAEVR